MEINEISGRADPKYKKIELSQINPADKAAVEGFAQVLQSELGIDLNVKTRNLGLISWQSGKDTYSLQTKPITGDKEYYWYFSSNGKADKVLGDIEDYTAKEIAKLIKSRYSVDEAKKNTTTANIASFQHKLGGNPDEGNCKEGFIWSAEDNKCVPQVDESIRDYISAAFVEKVGNYVKKLTGQSTEITGNKIKSGSIEVSVRQKGNKIEVSTTYPHKQYTDRKEFNIVGNEMKDMKNIIGFVKGEMAMFESTVSGQAYGNPSQGAVAGTDTRMGGPTFEPNFFEEPTDAEENERVFWDADQDQVLLQGFEYVTDYAKRTGQDVKSYDNVDDLRTDDEGGEEMEHELDMPQGNYKKLLQRLRKVHNI